MADQPSKKSSNTHPQLKKDHWVIMKFVNPKGMPIPTVRVRITTPDGVAHELASDMSGLVVVETKAQGSCRVEYL